MKNKAGNLAILSSQEIAQKTALGDRSYHEMVLALQTTLDLEQLLDLFSTHLKTVIPHSGLSFCNEPLGIELSIGKQGRHVCVYNLELENEPLGEWRMSRDRRFSEAELAHAEALLCRLLYPLRNGLKYREALCYAHTDQLTQTGNRAALLNSLQRELELARRYGTPLSIILLDVDHFKSINDNFGHDSGDAILRSVARSVKDSVRGSDILFRYGGEEFVILLSNTSKDGAVNLAERIRNTVEASSYGVRDLTLRVTLSLGVATLIPEETHLDLLRRADQVMYQAKRRGRNRVVA
jgi:diguanylate cyclase (GGDEF)-like protein